MPTFFIDGMERRNMYYLKTEQSFDSAHFLSGYQGKCANIHGHRWKIVVSIKSEQLLDDCQNRGMIIDFSDLKHDLKQITDNLDHSLIIETNSLSDKLFEALTEENFRIISLPFRPTAENLAKYIYDLLNEKYQVAQIDVYETPNNCASYRGQDE